jgi:hypothetical protein
LTVEANPLQILELSDSGFKITAIVVFKKRDEAKEQWLTPTIPAVLRQGR